MEILNVTTVEPHLEIGPVLAGCLLCILALAVFIETISLVHKVKDKKYLWMLLFPAAIMIGGIAVMFINRVSVAYNQYDVFFTGPVDMDELAEKYIITGRDGKIWHLEDKH